MDHSFRPSCFVFVHMCECQVKRFSMWLPRYLTSFVWGIGVLFRYTVGHWDFLSVNVMWVDLVSLTCMRHNFNHSSRLPKCRCSLLDAISAFLLTDIITVSSANVAVHVSPDNGKSEVKLCTKLDPRHYPAGLQMKFLQYLDFLLYFNKKVSVS